MRAHVFLHNADHVRYFQGPFSKKLYDLAQGPIERRSLVDPAAASHAPCSSRLASASRTWSAAYPLRNLESGEPSEELMGQLPAPGYVQ